MNWKQRRKNQRENFRLKAGFAILIFLTLLLIVGMGRRLPWQAFQLNISSEPKVILAPIPKDDPLLKLSNLLLQRHIDIVSAPQASFSALLVNLRSGGTIIFSTGKDIAVQVDSLQIILTRLTIEGKKFQSIDFRYDKPVVTY